MHAVGAVDQACVLLFQLAAERSTDARARGRRLGLATAHGLIAALNSCDWNGVRATLDERFVWTDHRPASYGRIEGVDLYVSIVRDIADAVPTLWVVEGLLGMDERGVLVEMSVEGELDGGAVQVAMLALVVYGEHGLAVALDTYGLDQREAAVAAFAELTP